jgi:hypothetical protein
MNISNNNPNGWYLGWVNNVIYQDAVYCSIAPTGSRGNASGSGYFQINPGSNSILDGYNTAGWTSLQTYTFGSASLSDGQGGYDPSKFVTISGSGLYDLGSVYANVYTGNCTAITNIPT